MGSCCGENPLVRARSWRLFLEEDGSGNISGRVETVGLVEHTFPPTIRWGTVTGTNEDDSVTMRFMYHNGMRERFEGHRIVDDRFVGRMDHLVAYGIEFIRPRF